MIDTRYCHQLRVKLPFLKIHLLQDYPQSIGSPQKRIFFNLLFNWCILFKAWVLLFGILILFCLTGIGTSNSSLYLHPKSSEISDHSLIVAQYSHISSWSEFLPHLNHCSASVQTSALYVYLKLHFNKKMMSC